MARRLLMLGFMQAHLASGRSLSWLFCSAAIVACSAGGSTSSTQQELISPSNLKVSVAVSSVTLGDEGCTGSAAAAPSGGLAAADCAPDASRKGGCGGCRASGVQLSFTTEAGGAAGKVALVKVALLDAGTGAELSGLTPANPTAWNGSSYATWNEMLAPSSLTKASYSLSAPPWSTLAGASSFTRQYQLEITVSVDGATIVVRSAPVTREAPVVT